MLVGRCSSELSSHKLQTKSKKVTSSERSDSQIYRVTPRLMARSRRACPEHSRGNPEDAYLAYAVRSFSTTEARVQDLAAALLAEGYGLQPVHTLKQNNGL